MPEQDPSKRLEASEVCGPHCEHPHDGNGPTACCPDGHGPYLYYCNDCHEEWRQANPERAAEIRRLASRLSGVKSC